jgi:hypothetical protein
MIEMERASMLTVPKHSISFHEFLIRYKSITKNFGKQVKFQYGMQKRVVIHLTVVVIYLDDKRIKTS